MEDEGVEFGMVNTETGEIRAGSMNKDGKMVFIRKPWWKRLFTKKPRETRYLGASDVIHTFTFNWRRMEETHCVAIYQDYNPYTQEVYQTYFNWQGRRRVRISTEAFAEGRLIVIS